MKKLLLLAVAVATLTTGCANLTPEQNAALGAGLMGAAAVGAAVADARRPVYIAPQPVVVVRPVYPRCVRFSTGNVVCN